MKFSLPWQSRAANNEKRDALEVAGNGFNLAAIWNFLDGGAQNNEERGACKRLYRTFHCHLLHGLQSPGRWYCHTTVQSLPADSERQDGRLR
jgi:hypothetical protein